MHLIFLATLLVSPLSPWLHPLLASSGTYAALAFRLLNHFHVLKFTVCLMFVRNIILDEQFAKRLLVARYAGCP